MELKNKLIKSHTYGDKERIRHHESMFNEIYEEFYDNLPEEEQLLVEVLQVRLDVFRVEILSLESVYLRNIFIRF